MVCLLILKVVYLMDIVGVFGVMIEILVIKVVVSNVVIKVIDVVIQIYGGGGVFNDFLLFSLYGYVWVLCLVDGFDEVYCGQIVCIELKKYK